MRFLIILCLCYLAAPSFGQSCLLPESMESLRPEKCAIRYIQPDPQGVRIILEFEKQGRILASHVPNKQTNGIKTSLRGIYELLFDPKGALLEEKRRYLQTGNIPADCNVFGLGDQQYQMLEEGISFIDQESYDNLPWLQKVSDEIKEDMSAATSTYFETHISVIPNTGQLGKLHSIEFLPSPDHDPEVIAQASFDLIDYDSSTKKAFWIAPFEPLTNQVNGDCQVILCRYNKKLDKYASSKIFRLVTFDTAGEERNREDLVFDYPMDLAYSFPHLRSDGHLMHQILLFRQQEVDTDINPKYDPGTLDYYIVNSTGQIVGAGKIEHSDIDAPFEPIDIRWTKSGLLLWHYQGKHITTFHINFDGTYTTHNLGDIAPKLQELVEERSAIHKPVMLDKSMDIQQLVQGKHLYVFKVIEDISIGQRQLSSYDISKSGTMISHGLLACLLSSEGKPVAINYYQRPEDADPQASLELSDVIRNESGITSFYLQETTSSGLHPILVRVEENSIHIDEAIRARPVSRQIYSDPSIPLVAFFAKVADSKDPKQVYRTIEVLQKQSGPVDMSGLDPAYRK